MRRVGMPRWIVVVVVIGAVLPAMPARAYEPPEPVKSTLNWADLPFEDGFEDVSTTEELIAPQRWSYRQIAPAESTNYMEISSAFAHSGNQSVHFHARAGSPSITYPGAPEGTASKSALHKNGTYAFQSEALEVSAWFYFDGEADLDDIFLLDYECQYTCANQGAGPRVALVDGYPIVEFGQIELPNIVQTEHAVRTNEWFQLTWRMRFGPAPIGSTQLYLNGRKIIDARETTTSWLPAVDRLKIGLTANSSELDADLYVDDVHLAWYAR